MPGIPAEFIALGPWAGFAAVFVPLVFGYLIIEFVFWLAKRCARVR